MNYAEQMQKIWNEYQDAGMPIPATSRDVAAWAIHKGLWKPRPADIVSQCADDLSRALREEYRTDKNGRRYRSKHAVRINSGGTQLTFWADIDSAPRSHMEKAFAQRRRQIIGDCYQLKTDVDCYNNAHSSEPPINLVLDFTMDVKEIDVMNGFDQKSA
ncbi:MAG: hypothetical protein LM517_09755 [Nitrosomonas sp.]|nr:hypothetical protein [Nitrosomonas sp.]